MRTVVLAILIGLPLGVVSSPSVQAAGAKKPDAEYCGMGECFPQYITSMRKDHSGLIIVRTRMEHYCMPGNSCNSATHDPPKTLTYKVQCKTPGGYIETGWAADTRARERAAPRPSRVTHRSTARRR